MITLDLKNIHAVGPSHGFKKSDLKISKKDLTNLLNKIHDRGESFYKIVDDTSVLDDVEAFANERKGRYKHIVVIGIGGSALGTICLQEAFSHLYKAKEDHKPTLHILDNVDPTLYKELEDILDLKKTLFLLVSKSGNTAEVLAPYLYFANVLKKKKLLLRDHFAAITHSGKGILFDIAVKEKMPIIEHGPVGGRFAVLSSVGLVPAVLLGMDIRELMRGATEMRDRFMSADMKENLPYQIARTQLELRKKGKTINVMMPYAQKLRAFADWYRQLLAESIGKEKNESGKVVHTGITPVKALGTTDQHSQSQLYNEGPNDKLIMFIRVASFGKKLRIPTLYRTDKRLAYLQGASFDDLLDAERDGTAHAYTKRQRPNLTLTIDAIDEYHLGSLFMLFEGATALLGEMLKINAFNQPGVELAKKMTVTYLKKQR